MQLKHWKYVCMMEGGGEGGGGERRVKSHGD